MGYDAEMENYKKTVSAAKRILEVSIERQLTVSEFKQAIKFVEDMAYLSSSANTPR